MLKIQKYKYIIYMIYIQYIPHKHTWYKLQIHI